MGNRKYTCNQNFFSEPNIINSYWAGFIAADGYVYKNGNQLTIMLQKRDREHLMKFKEIIDFTGIIRYDNRNCCYMSLCNKCILNDLYNHFSIVQKKSLILQPPKIIMEDYIRSYLRGYFDGDGCLSFNKSHNMWITSISSGSIDLLQWIQVYIRNFIPNIKYNICQQNKVYKLEFGSSKQSLRFLQWLYIHSDYITRLDRKYELFIKFQKEYIEKRNQLTSQYNGVRYKNNKWEASLMYHCKRKWLGTFDTEKEAALAYNREACRLGIYDRCYEVI